MTSPHGGSVSRSWESRCIRQVSPCHPFRLSAPLRLNGEINAWYFGEQNEKYILQFRFDPQYPISSPAVQFVVEDGREAPIHPVRIHIPKPAPGRLVELTCALCSMYTRMDMYGQKILVTSFYLTSNPIGFFVLDLCLDSGERVVTRPQRNCGLCHPPEHVSLLQGRRLSHVHACQSLLVISPLSLVLHRLQTPQKKER